jgi:hypothetical protein
MRQLQMLLLSLILLILNLLQQRREHGSGLFAVLGG